MANMNLPSYSRELRANAKRDHEWMVTCDFVRPDGSRYLSSQGLFSKGEAKVVADALLAALAMRRKRVGKKE